MSSRVTPFGRLLPSIRATMLPICVGLLLGVWPTLSLHAQPPARLIAPEFDGAVGPTIGSDKPIKLKDLRGKIVVLEFWTLC
jgi:hypothetical protein